MTLSTIGKTTVWESKRVDSQRDDLPRLLTPGEVAALLRTSRGAVYQMVSRNQLPGVVRVGRRVLIRQEALLDWLRQKPTPSKENPR